MILEIPLNPIVAQSLKVVLNEQSCEILIRERLDNLYMSLVVDDETAWNNFVCYDRQNIKPHSYLPFSGGLYFIDKEGSTDPIASGLNTRYFLIYLSEDEELPEGFVNNA